MMVPMVSGLAAADWAILAAYLGLMLWIGRVAAARIGRFRDYFLAGGALTTPLLVCSLVSTYYELDVTLATSERAFYDGLVAWTWESRPYYVAILAAALLLTPRLKRERAAMTLPDILDRHYGLGARVAGATACFVYSLPITALAGLTTMLTVLGMPPAAGLLLATLVCAVYTAGGGMWADMMTDTVQFVLMSVSLAVALPLALDRVGGFGALAALPAGHLTSTGDASPWLRLSWVCAALTIFVEPFFYQRIFAAKDARDVRKAMLVGIVLWAAYDWAVTMMGLLARVAVDQGLLPGATEGRESLVALSLLALPVGLKGLFVAGVLAAAMSSVDSYSLLASGNLTYDILRPLWPRPLLDRVLIRLTRIGVVAVLAAGAAVALLFERISDAWMFMASVLVASVLVPVLGALFLRPRRAAGLAACLLGLAGLAAFYAWIYARGAPDPAEGSWVWRSGGVEVWREYAVLFALPCSALGYAAGNLLGRKS